MLYIFPNEKKLNLR